MFSDLAALLVVAVVLVASYRYATGSGRRVVALFDRYRPHAPMADWSLREGPSSGPRECREPREDLAALRGRQTCVASDQSATRPPATP
ncbi:hypothetical protein [Nocardia africana]|uniref:Uncharacterized protein n=1 Tax=Nocardia africana TaxID=134964 RepID=A0A378X6Q7_9NOCA|nr:hypothetical protein [Nocardia africana]MCC3317716.1 hypothetical protein [Nocardia africana]SUA48475.1 Uncharacterised protein [Nocardia africana]